MEAAIARSLGVVPLGKGLDMKPGQKHVAEPSNLLQRYAKLQ